MIKIAMVNRWIISLTLGVEYLIKSIDFDKDGDLDRVVSSAAYTGEELILFENKKGSFEHLLSDWNFTIDGVQILENILKGDDNHSFSITTFFPDRGVNMRTHYIKIENSQLIVSKTMYFIQIWQERKTYICEVDQNYELGKNALEMGLYNHIDENLDKDKECIVLENYPVSAKDYLELIQNGVPFQYLGEGHYSNLLSTHPLNDKSLLDYNNLAFYLEKKGAYTEALFILEKICALYPDRTVAYINIGDSYYGLGEIDKSLESYIKYKEKMEEKGAASKIPKRIINILKKHSAL